MMMSSQSQTVKSSPVCNRCATLVGAGLSKTVSAFEAAVAECAAYAPSLLVLDNLDLVCASEVSEWSRRVV